MLLSTQCRVLSHLVVLTASVLALSACRVQSTVSVEVANNGSGTVGVEVFLDEKATAAVGNLERQLRYEDLIDAGWLVDRPVLTDEGGTQVTAAKPFQVPDQLGTVLDEVLGPGVFDDFELVRERSFGTTAWTISGLVDLSRGLDLFSDPALAEVFSGLPLGRTTEELAELVDCELPCDPAQAFTLDFVVTLLDAPDSPAGSARSSVQLGDRTATPFELSWTIRHRTPRLWRVASLLLAGMVIVALTVQGVRALLRRRTTPATVPPVRARRQASEIIEQPSQSSGDPVDRSVQLVVVGGTGVVWQGGTGPEGLLVPFVRARGGIVDSEEIADRYRSASLGQVSTAEFWLSIGVPGDPDALDGDYLARVRLRSDARLFLEQMATRGLPVACMTNAVLSWTQHLRQGLGLEELIAHWVVSGEVGARKPSNAMFEAVRRMTGVSYHNMLLIDSDSSTLEAGRGVGMSTVLMRGRTLVPGGFAHPVIDGFADLFRARGQGLRSRDGSRPDQPVD